MDLYGTESLYGNRDMTDIPEEALFRPSWEIFGIKALGVAILHVLPSRFLELSGPFKTIF